MAGGGGGGGGSDDDDAAAAWNRGRDYSVLAARVMGINRVGVLRRCPSDGLAVNGERGEEATTRAAGKFWLAVSPKGL